MINKLSFIISALGVLTTTGAMAQQTEIVNTKSISSYQGKSYFYVQSVTLQSGFQVSGAQHGTFFISPLAKDDKLPPTQDANFVRTEKVLVQGIKDQNDLTNLTVANKEKSVGYSYFDGLARGVQNIDVQASVILKDIVSPVTYDDNGRIINDFLPYPANGLPGSWRSTSASDQLSFYQTAPTGVASDSRPYTEKIHEPSPLNRVTSEFGVGNSWFSASKKVSAVVKMNVANEVPLWKDLVTGLPERNGYHATNTLLVQETTNEEDKITKVYSNLRGQTVMSRVGDGTEWFDTHYIYSPSGLTMFVIQPEGVGRLATEFENASAADKQSFLDRWAFQYQYDDEQREIAKRIPGFKEGSEGWSFTIYDKWNRVVFTQDPEQRARDEYSFNKYDLFNRVIMTGLYNSSSDRPTLQASVNSYYNSNPNNRFESRLNNSTGYTQNVTFPQNPSESLLLTVTYYDDYSFISYSNWDAEANNFAFVNVSGYPQDTELLKAGGVQQAKGHATGSKVRVLDGLGKWLNSVTHYDKKYRPIQVISESHLDGIIRTTSKFDFVGKVKKEQFYNSYSSLTVQNRYAYDHAGRLLTMHHQVNNQAEVLMVSNNYNEIGQLIEKNVHSTDNGATFLQSVDHRYNIRGWLTHINNSSFTSNWTNNDTNDLFGMELQYNVQSPATVGASGDTFAQKNLYDGNISAIKWKVDTKQGTPEERIYAFDYDRLSRLKTAHYAKNTATSASPSWTGDSGMFDEIIHGYDKNGNIKVTDGSGNPGVALTRYSKVEGSKTTIDQLKYGYQVSTKYSNRLIDIDDTGTSVLGFKPAAASITEEYQYYRNGNLKFDHNRDISNILYNHLNLVKEVQFTRPGGQVDKVEYTYDATGNKLSQLVRINAAQVWKTDYIGGMQYDNGTLSFIFTKEGRLVNNNGTFEYEYFHKDHQGNVRVVYGSLKETSSYRATMEPALASTEEVEFYNVAETRPAYSTPNYTQPSEQVIAPDRSAECNAYTGKAIGPAKKLTVSAGDRVYMETFAQYTQVTGSSTTTALSALVAAVTGTFDISSGENLVLWQSFNDNMAAITGAMGAANTVTPKAYLVWIFINDNDQYVNSGGMAITTNAYNAFEKLSRSFIATQNGDLYIYVASESNVSAVTNVYFDETYIVHEKNNVTLQVLQASDYYPFGLSFNQYQADRLKEISSGNYTTELRNRYLFQGQELQKDLDLGWYQFKWRMHDPAIGRFGAVDPLSEKYLYNSTYAFSENKVIGHVELEGLESFWSIAPFFGAVKTVTEAVEYDPSFSDYVKTGFGMLWNGSQLGSGYNNIVIGTTREASSKVDFALNGGEQIQQAIQSGESPQQVIDQHTQEQAEGRMQAYTGMAQVTLFSTSLQASLFTGGLSSSTSAFSLSSSNYGAPLFKPSFSIGTKGSGYPFRYVSQAEIGAIKDTGLLRGGLPGETYFTKDVYRSGLRAQQRLSLSGTPTHRIEFEILNEPTLLRNGTKVDPIPGHPGGGSEFMTLDPVRVRLINAQRLR